MIKNYKKSSPGNTLGNYTEDIYNEIISAISYTKKFSEKHHVFYFNEDICVKLKVVSRAPSSMFDEQFCNHYTISFAKNGVLCKNGKNPSQVYFYKSTTKSIKEYYFCENGYLHRINGKASSDYYSKGMYSTYLHGKLVVQSKYKSIVL